MAHLNRPPFELRSLHPPEQVLHSFRQRLSLYPRDMAGVVSEGNIELFAPSERQDLWSPQLMVEVKPLHQGSLLRVRYGLHPNVWTLNMALAGVSCVTILVSSCLGWAQWTLGESPRALIAIELVALLWMLRHVLHRWGWRRSEQQALALRSYLELSLASPESTEFTPPHA